MVATRTFSYPSTGRVSMGVIFLFLFAHEDAFSFHLKTILKTLMGHTMFDKWAYRNASPQSNAFLQQHASRRDLQCRVTNRQDSAFRSPNASLKETNNEAFPDALAARRVSVRGRFSPRPNDAVAESERELRGPTPDHKIGSHRSEVAPEEDRRSCQPDRQSRWHLSLFRRREGKETGSRFQYCVRTEEQPGRRDRVPALREYVERTTME